MRSALMVGAGLCRSIFEADAVFNGKVPHEGAKGAAVGH